VARGLYWATLLVLAACMTGTVWLLGTHFGRVLTAIRDNENRVRFLGYNPAAFKIAAFAFGGLMSGLSGALYTLHLGTISPAMIGVTFSIELVVWVALGGRNSLLGAVGGLVLGLIENFLGVISIFGSVFPKLAFLGAIKAEYKDVGAFIALIVILIFKPSGLLGRNTTEKV